MVELIDKWKVVDMLTALENEFQHYKPFHGFEHAMYRKLVEVEMEIGKIPAVEAEPVVHAHWITEMDDLGWLKHTCSNCGYTKRTDIHVSLGWNGCPTCCAHMDEEVADV